MSYRSVSDYHKTTSTITNILSDVFHDINDLSLSNIVSCIDGSILYVPSLEKLTINQRKNLDHMYVHEDEIYIYYDGNKAIIKIDDILNLKYLDMNVDDDYTKVLIIGLGNLRGLEELKIPYAILSKLDIARLSGNLKRLSLIMRNDNVILDSINHNINNFCNLTHLDAWSTVDDHLTDYIYLLSLRKLTVRYIPIRGIPDVLPKKRLPLTIRHLKIYNYCDIIYNSLVKGLEHITSLSLDSGTTTNMPVKIVNPNLKNIHLRCERRHIPNIFKLYRMSLEKLTIDYIDDSSMDNRDLISRPSFGDKMMTI